MLSSIMGILSPVLGFLASQYGVVGTVLGYMVMVGIPMVSVLIELLEFIVSLTSSTADDAVAQKIQSIWDAVLPYLEVLPHANLPLSAILLTILDYAGRGMAAIKAAVSSWKQGPPAPPSGQ